MCVCVCVCQVVVQPQAPPTVTLIQRKPDNYIVLSVLTLLCCCWLFGLVALMYGMQVFTISCSLGEYTFEFVVVCRLIRPIQEEMSQQHRLLLERLRHGTLSVSQLDVCLLVWLFFLHSFQLWSQKIIIKTPLFPLGHPVFLN